MFYIFLIFHLFLIIESYSLFKKKLRRKSLLLLLINIIVMIINIIKLYPTITNEINYSSVIFIISLLKNHPITSLFWFLINLSFLGFTNYIIKVSEQRKKQNQILKIILYIFIAIIFFFLAITLFNKIAALLLFLTILLSLFLLGKAFIKGKQNYYLATIIILIIFTVYSFGMYTGAARLQIALQGYPIEAYNTGLEEMKFYREENMKKFIPIQNLPTDEEDIGLIQVKNYLIIKFGTYYQY